MGGEEKGREDETVLAILVRYRGKGLERQLCSLLRRRGLGKVAMKSYRCYSRLPQKNQHYFHFSIFLDFPQWFPFSCDAKRDRSQGIPSHERQRLKIGKKICQRHALGHPKGKSGLRDGKKVFFASLSGAFWLCRPRVPCFPGKKMKRSPKAPPPHSPAGEGYPDLHSYSGGEPGQVCLPSHIHPFSSSSAPATVAAG